MLFRSEELRRYVQETGALESADEGSKVSVQYLGNFSSGRWAKFQAYTRSLADSSPVLDENLVFANDPVGREMYASRRLPYALEPGEAPCFDELMATLYDPQELEKLLWSIGAIVDGASKEIQKFVVLYGAAGSGKSTVLNIIQDLFAGYYTVFDAKALGVIER